MEMSSDRLILKYELEGAVEIEKLCLSFEALASQFRQTLFKKGIQSSEVDARLFLTKVASGSIEAEIGIAIVAFGQTMSTFDYVLTFADLTDRIRRILDWASGRSEMYASPTSGECRDLKNFIAPLVGRKKTGLRISHARFSKAEKNGNQLKEIIAEYYISGPDIENAEIALDAESLTALPADQLSFRTFQSVEMRLQQANIGEAKSSGRSSDRALIPTISSKAVPVFFPPGAAALKSKLINIELNPLRVSYSVDVYVTYEADKPVAYTILDVHGATAIRSESQGGNLLE